MSDNQATAENEMSIHEDVQKAAAANGNALAAAEKSSLENEPLHLTRGENGEMFVQQDGKPVPVQVCLCFPWTDRRRFISLRNYEGKEMALVPDIAVLEQDSRDAIERALAESGFVLEILSIESLKDEIEIRNWKVHTAQGLRTFQTKLDDWPRVLEGKGLLFRDVAGDLYYVPRPHQLDEKSRKLLYTFMD